MFHQQWKDDPVLTELFIEVPSAGYPVARNIAYTADYHALLCHSPVNCCNNNSCDNCNTWVCRSAQGNQG